MIHRRTGTVGDQSSHCQWGHVAVSIMSVTIKLLVFTQGRELSVTKKEQYTEGRGTVGDQSSYRQWKGITGE